MVKLVATKSKLDTYFAAVEMSSEKCSDKLPCPYGSFDRKTGTFTITNPLTPRPWVNVLSNGSYGAVISQFGGGFSWINNSQLLRITRWEQDLAIDNYGRWVYVYDIESKRVSSTTYAPVREPAEVDEIIHGLGYTTFRRQIDGISTEHTIFVPQDANVEHWLISVRNSSDRRRSLRIGTFVEWFLGSQREWHREFHRLFMSTEVYGDTLVCQKRPELIEGSRKRSSDQMVGFLQVVGLDNITWFADKQAFVGRRGKLDSPDGLVSDVSGVVTGKWDDPVAALRAPLIVEPGQTVQFAFTLGATVSGAQEGDLRCNSSLDTIRERLEQTKEHFLGRCGSLQIESSDPSFDTMMNTWLPYQAETGRMLARCAYYQQGGAYGYRDQLQDSLSLLDTDPSATLVQLGIHAEAMYEDGGVRHWWHPNSEIFAQSKHSDTCLWLAYGVLEYLDETDNLAALNLQFKYLSRESELHSSSGTLLEHCVRGIQRALGMRSERGLPLILSGDWNDGLSHAGIDGDGESVWLAMFLFHILQRFVPILNSLADFEIAAEFQVEAQKLQAAVELHAWDGDWYVAGISDNGKPFGSRTCEAGQLFLNPQTWAVLSGIASAERTQASLNAVRQHLVKPYGALLLIPAYKNLDPDVGYITRYAPGLRENGGVYSHASTWAVRAFQIAGDTKTAWNLFRSMLPTRGLEDPESYQAEPYVMPGNVDGPDSPYEGRAGWTWYTGAAAWMRRVGLHDILGVRPTKEGLQFSTNVPRELCPVRLTRNFRGDKFEIEIKCGEKDEIVVDGIPCTAAIVPASGECKKRLIQVFVRS